MRSAHILKADGTRQDLGRRPTLAEAQKIVGGYIELVSIQGTKFTLVVNEDGHSQNLPFNSKATEYWLHSPIVGDVIVLEGWRTVGG